MSSLTPSARTTSRKSASKFINPDTKRSTEKDALERTNLYDAISNNDSTDVITDGGEALRAEHWLRHQTLEDVQSIQPGATASAAEAEVFKVGKDDEDVSSSDASDISANQSRTATQLKNTEHQPDLRKRLKAACIRNVDGKSFIPVDRLYNLITRESVTEELQRVAQRTGTPLPFSRSIHQIANAVCPAHGDSTLHIRGNGNALKSASMRKIFGILVSMDMSTSIEVFLDNDVSDVDLPLKITRRESTTRIFSSAGGEVKVLGGHLAEYDESTDNLVEKFIDRQWEFIAPFFAPFFAPRSSGVRDAIPHYKLSQEDILPWTNEKQPETALSHQGGFGTVWRVRIHPSHHGFMDDAQVIAYGTPYCHHFACIN